MTVKNCPSEELQLPESPVDKKKNEEVIPVENDSDTDDYSEDILDLKLHNDNNNEIANNAQFNITSSQHVVIGNVTHVHGALTINQNAIGNEISINSEEEAAKIEDVQYLDKRKLPAALDSRKEPFNGLSLNKKYTIIAAVVATILFLTLCGLLLTLLPKQDIPYSKYGSEIGRFKLLYYYDWGGVPHKSFIKALEAPVPLVIIKHTAGRFCTTIEFCTEIVNWLQSDEMLKNEPDIIYNFLIGGTGDIFVGRGWDYQNHQRNNAIDIAFIGNFGYMELNKDMIEAAQLLIDSGVKLGKIHKNYKLLPHNQTSATAGPGKNVYQVIKNWPHYFDKSL